MIKSLGRALWSFLTNEWCQHEWETVEEFYIWKDAFWNIEHLTHEKIQPSNNFACKGKVYHQKCIHCGEMRQERVNI